MVSGDGQHVHDAGIGVAVAHLRVEVVRVGDEQRADEARVTAEVVVDALAGAVAERGKQRRRHVGHPAAERQPLARHARAVDARGIRADARAEGGDEQEGADRGAP